MPSLFTPGQRTLAATIVSRCTGAGLRLATAESCTGGLIAACLTEIPGASLVLDRGFIVYDNAAKREVLGVAAEILDRDGAVSEAAARAMAEGALARAPVDIAIAVTGIAGPGGGSADKPVGLVWLALARRGRPTHTERALFAGDRHAVRAATLERALARLAEAAA